MTKAGRNINNAMCLKINAFLNVTPNIVSEIDIKKANEKANHRGYSEKTIFWRVLIGLTRLVVLVAFVTVGLCIFAINEISFD